MPAEAEAYNSIQLIGNLGNDPEMKHLPSGSYVAECRIAVYNGKDKSTGQPKPPMWITVKAWNSVAETLGAFRKGDRLQVVRGQWSQDNWQDRETGANRTKDYCLAWEVAKIERQPKPAPNYDEDPF
jgi:single-strand DNA-binding protein